MPNSNKLLLCIFIILLLILLGETGYFFYYQIRVKDQSSQNQIKGKTDLINLISKANNKQSILVNGIVYGTTYLEKDNPSLQCSYGPFCVEIDNKENIWSQYDAHSMAVNIDSPFFVKLSLKNKNGLSGISLNGRINSSTNQWWENISSVFIGLQDDGSRLYIDARNGTSADSFGLLDKEVKNIVAFNIFFDKNGKYVLITDEKYQILTYLDINQITNNQFPDGLFPDGKIYLGAGVAPNSYLALTTFVIIPIRN